MCSCGGGLSELEKWLQLMNFVSLLITANDDITYALNLTRLVVNQQVMCTKCGGIFLSRSWKKRTWRWTWSQCLELQVIPVFAESALIPLKVSMKRKAGY